MSTRVTAAPYGTLPDGQPVLGFELSNDRGIRVGVIELGAIITRLLTPDRHGSMADIVLGFDDLGGYLAGSSYFGAVVGRYANRIANGAFELDGRAYALATNDGAHHLHGGRHGFDRQLWRGTSAADSVTLTLVSPDGDEGYPGELRVSVTYTLTADALHVRYHATSDAPTIVNLAQHSYFNLGASGVIEDHELAIAADHYTPVDATLIPTGEIAPVAGTPFDFRAARRIGRDLAAHDRQLDIGGGYDHNFVLSDPLGADGLRHAATVSDPDSGRQLSVRTDQPGLQFYSGNFLDGTTPGKAGYHYPRRGGLCLETQHFPNSPNVAHFPNTVLRPGATFASHTVFQFGVRGEG